jgi:hypothetical protein
MTDDIEIVPADNDDGDREPEAAVHEPGKLMRIGLMLREMLEEVRRAETDEAGRDRIRQIYERALEELRGVLSVDLRSELDMLTLPFDTEGVPSESEIRIAQAQLIGWLEGLFQGIQAALMNQQMLARQQLEQMRQRGLPSGAMPPGMHPGGQGPEHGEGPGQRRGTGQYL